MGMTLMGLIFWPLSFLFFKRPQRLLELAMIGGVFQAAAVLVLGGLGLQPPMAPALIFMGFIGLQAALGVKFPRVGRVLLFCMPLLLTLGWTIFGSLVMPRLFEGSVQVWPQKLDAVGTRVPLAPSRGNFSQDSYVILDAAIFVAAICYLMRQEADLKRLYGAYLLGGVLTCVIGFWEMAHRLVGAIPFPKELFYSNPSWAILDTQMSGPVPRINSTFSEPAACATALAGFVYSTTWCILRGYGGWATRLVLAGSVLCLLVTTSTTGYIALAAGIGLLMVYAIVSRSSHLMKKLIIFIFGSVLCFGLMTAVLSAFAPDVIKAAAGVMIDTQGKKQSASYEERSQKDADSMQLLFDTYGLGAGWGSNRSSSLMPSFLSTVGIVGVFGLVVWNLRLFLSTVKALRIPDREQSVEAWMVEATLTALLGRTIGTMISGPVLGTVDFYILIAMLVTSIIKLRDRARLEGRGIRIA